MKYAIYLYGEENECLAEELCGGCCAYEIQADGKTIASVEPIYEDTVLVTVEENGFDVCVWLEEYDFDLDRGAVYAISDTGEESNVSLGTPYWWAVANRPDSINVHA